MIKIGNRKIGQGYPTYIIAEIGSSFDGDLQRVKYLAKLAKDSGADAFKIQNFSAPKIVSEKGFSGLKISFQKNWDESVFNVYKKSEFPHQWVKELFDYCKKIGIDFLSSPYDKQAVELLEKVEVSAYKIGSGEIDNLDFLEYVASKGKPILLGTGACNLSDIKKAIGVIKKTGNKKIVLFQCVTSYPVLLKYANIKAMVAIKEKFKVEVGYSDHTIGREGGGDDPLSGITVPLAAVALGAAVIEKHFTDDRKRKGPDHNFAMEAEDFKKMADAIRALEKALGDGKKKVEDSERETVVIQRRGIYAKKDIKPGEIISFENIDFLRPALFLRPPQSKRILGRKAKNNIKSGDPIKLDDVA